MRAGAGVDELRVAQIRRDGRVQLRAGAEARVHMPFAAQTVQYILINAAPLRLVQRRRIPAEAEKTQIINRLLCQRARAAGNIYILNAQQKLPALTARGQVRQHRAEQIAQMQPSAGSRRETSYHRGITPSSP